MSYTPLSTVIMPSENTFKHHAELARTALNNFNTIRKLDSPGLIKTAFDELVAVMVEFVQFAPFFTHHPLFIEIPPLVHAALEDYLAKNPNFVKPPMYNKVIGLSARAKDAAALAARKGMSPSLPSFILTFLTFLLSFFC